jgi:hypothetical protein
MSQQELEQIQIRNTADIPISFVSHKGDTQKEFAALFNSAIITEAFGRKREKIYHKPCGAFYDKHWPERAYAGLSICLSSSMTLVKDIYWQDQEKWLSTTSATDKAYGINKWSHCSMYFCTKDLVCDPKLLHDLISACMLNEEYGGHAGYIIFCKDCDIYVTDLFSKVFKFESNCLIPIVVRFEECGENFDPAVYDSLSSTLECFMSW